MEKICLSQRRIDEIKNVCRKYGNDPGELINILHGVQDLSLIHISEPTRRS